LRAELCVCSVLEAGRWKKNRRMDFLFVKRSPSSEQNTGKKHESGERASHSVEGKTKLKTLQFFRCRRRAREKKRKANHSRKRKKYNTQSSLKIISTVIKSKKKQEKNLGGLRGRHKTKYKDDNPFQCDGSRVNNHNRPGEDRKTLLCA